MPHRPQEIPLKKTKTRRITDITDIRDRSEQNSQPNRRIELIPRNRAQETYIQYLEDPTKRITLAVGPAGTGKTYLGVLEAIKTLKQGKTQRIILTRPAVHVEEEKFGFLPGTIEEKLTPWLIPIMDIMKEYYSICEIKNMMENEIIEISPLAFMRGRTFKNCIIILDEAQNTTPAQMKMILTRLGTGSRIIVTGDLEQSDHKKENGLVNFLNKVEAFENDRIAVARFYNKHVERDEIVKDVLEIYNN